MCAAVTQNPASKNLTSLCICGNLNRHSVQQTNKLKNCTVQLLNNVHKFTEFRA